MVGKMLNRAKDRSVSMPLVPRSITRDRPAGLALQVKAQGQGMDMGEGLHRHFAHGMILHLGEDAVAQLGEGLHQDARDHIGRDQGQHRADGDVGGRGPQRGPPPSRRTGARCW